LEDIAEILGPADDGADGLAVKLAEDGEPARRRKPEIRPCGTGLGVVFGIFEELDRVAEAFGKDGGHQFDEGLGVDLGERDLGDVGLVGYGRFRFEGAEYRGARWVVARLLKDACGGATIALGMGGCFA